MLKFQGWNASKCVVSEMTYTVSSGTLNSSIPYHQSAFGGWALLRISGAAHYHPKHSLVGWEEEHSSPFPPRCLKRLGLKPSLAPMASELILEWGRRGEARAESGGWDSWGGAASPSSQTRGLRERCKLPQRGPGQSPGRQRVFLYSMPSDCLSQHLGTCCIQFAWLGIRFFYGGYTYQYIPT